MRIELCSKVVDRFVALVLPFLALVFSFSMPMTAQDPTITTVELVHGYVTAVNAPEGFDVHDEHILLQPLTAFRLKGGEPMTFDNSLRNELRPGAYVWVLGKVKNKKPMADAVVFREDWNQQISGLGPVNALVEAGIEREFRADGFTIRVPSSAAASFRGDVHNLNEVGAGTWLHYKGKLDAHGVLVAASADFLSTKPGKPVELVNGLDDYKIPFFPPDFARHGDGRVKPGRLKAWGTIPADQVLHDRLQRIGTKLIPQFQRSLADDDPRKIPFLFYAVDDDDKRTFICAPRGGLIFYPRYLIERMQNEDQLAAALAMPIAIVLQRQGLGKEMRQWPAVRDQLSTLALYATIPYFGAFPLDMMGALPDHRIATRVGEQVGRIAISLVADAGYDPWQAPEAFRLMAATRSPNGATSVKQTHLSEYALSILNLEYGRATTSKAKHAESK
jgi:hypothetical protein